MAGIYIHIPFCRQACHYCDFHFSTSLETKQAFLASLAKEIELSKDYLSGKNISTIYFGGGTPSVLSKEEIETILDALALNFTIDADAEITLEANPDDLSEKKIKELSKTPVNRLSIGIQSFSDVDLKFLNRIHDAKEAIASVNNAKDAGFKNITIDLIYGTQTLSNEQWIKNIESAFALPIQHISCYSLTVEPKTALHSFIQKGKVQEVDAGKSAEHFEILMDKMRGNDFIHYEISNFCKEGFYSKHNSSYWKGEHYLGLGPSAHSYNGYSRRWNVKSNTGYISSLNKNILPFENEWLTDEHKFNEYILTALRTMWGVDLNYIKENFSEETMHRLDQEIKPFLDNKMIVQKEKKIFLTEKGKLFADKIASDLFSV